MYHYQHQKQQIIAMENQTNGERNGSLSDVETDEENEEGDYTVYECPGLAPVCIFPFFTFTDKYWIYRTCTHVSHIKMLKTLSATEPITFISFRILNGTKRHTNINRLTSITFTCQLHSNCMIMKFTIQIGHIRYELRIIFHVIVSNVQNTISP